MGLRDHQPGGQPVPSGYTTAMTDLARPRPETDDPAPRRRRVNQTVELGAAYAWRILAIAALLVAVIWLTGQLLVVVIPLAVAALLTRALSPIASMLRNRGLKPAAAAAVTLIGFLIMLSATIALVGVAVAGEIDDLGPTLNEGVDDVIDWIVDDSPFDISRSDIDGWRDRAGEALSSFVSSGEGSVLSGALLAGEVVIGALLSLIVTFFFLKDGRRMVTTALGAVGSGHRQRAERAAASSIGPTSSQPTALLTAMVLSSSTRIASATVPCASGLAV